MKLNPKVSRIAWLMPWIWRDVMVEPITEHEADNTAYIAIAIGLVLFFVSLTVLFW